MSEDDPLVGKTLADRFEIVERIGEGGTGVVYKAKQLSVDRTIAIKVLGAHVSTDPQWVKRFHNEARAASRLDHPNTVRLIDFGQTREGLLFIAMEFLHGRSLRQEIERVRRLPPDRVLRIVCQMCASLSEAHNQGIIHRDIKPDNVYLVDMKGAGDLVKVLDFSVAKLDTPDAQLTRAGMIFGTPQYMSPEQGRGVPLDARSDIYAVGIVAYEMLTGKPPFDARIPTEVVMMHLRDRPAPIGDVPVPIAEVFMRALEKDPARRQQSAEELNAQCDEIMAQLYPRPPSGVHMQISATAPPPAAAPARAAASPPAAASPRVTAPPAAAAKTMLAAEAPPAVRSAAAPAAEMKTVMGMAAPSLGAPPPAAPPPPSAVGAPPPAAPPPPGAAAAMKTMMATEAPSAATGAAAMKTMMAQPAPGLGGAAAGTQVISDPKQAVAYAAHEAVKRARTSGENAQITATRPPGAVFWLAWALLGVGVGLGIHFWLLSRG